jgi:predicted metal-dependent phosphoesterase TrpH
MSSVDLHIHSTFSDGLLTPRELVHLAIDKGIKGLALTDHDTIDGLNEFIQAGKETGLEVIPGIEISAYFGEQPIHILGYGFNRSHPHLNKQIQVMQQIREERNRKMQKRFESLGISLTDDELTGISAGQIGRPHFARVLVDKKIVASLDQAFQLFLKKNGRAYVAKEKYPARQAIAAIREAGGIAVLAHPWCSDHSLASIPLLLNRLKDIGLQGIEVYYPAHSRDVRDRLLSMAEKFDLVVTGGSDFHGTDKSPLLAGDRKGSLTVPVEVLQRLTSSKLQ